MVPTLIIPGLFGSKPGHWQRHWLNDFPQARLRKYNLKELSFAYRTMIWPQAVMEHGFKRMFIH